MSQPAPLAAALAKLKRCERCHAREVFARGHRYCRRCAALVLRRLEEDGYLQSVPYQRHLAERAGRLEEPS